MGQLQARWDQDDFRYGRAPFEVTLADDLKWLEPHLASPGACWPRSILKLGVYAGVTGREAWKESLGREGEPPGPGACAVELHAWTTADR